MGIPMGTNSAPLLAKLFVFCYERDFMMYLSEGKQSEVIEAFSSTSRYLDDLSNIDNQHFDGLISQIYPSELQLNTASSSVTVSHVFCLHLYLSILDGFISYKSYDKRDDFDFEIINFPSLHRDAPHLASYGIYISQLIRFARVSSHITDFHTRNKLLTSLLQIQDHRYHKLCKAFSKFYRRHFDLISKFNVELKSLLQQGLSDSNYYGDCFQRQSFCRL